MFQHQITTVYILSFYYSSLFNQNIYSMQSQSASLQKKKKQHDVRLCPIQMKKLEYNFIPPDYTQITRALYKKMPLEKLLKLIHKKFLDEGLTSSLIHRIYDSSELQIEYYVPELVYIAVRKKCRPMRKVLAYKASVSQNLRRLILWNIKAFTVLMIQKDEKLKLFINQFQQQVTRTVKDQTKFQNSEKAISMLATASLALKKLPKQVIKQKLKLFIKRFNYEILKDLDHSIIIPFRHSQNEKNISSNYVVRIIQDNCSCFPTRKRVPYRIILETVDINELKSHSQAKNLINFNKQKPNPDKEKDLFNDVSEEVEKQFKSKDGLKVRDNKYPFVIDQQQISNITELNKFAKQVESEQKKQQKQRQTSIKKKSLLRRQTIATFKSKGRLSKMQQNLVFNKGKFQIKDNQHLRRFDAIFIPTLPSNLRKSDINEPKGLWITLEKIKNKKRFSEGNSESQTKNIKIIEQQVKYEGNSAQSVWKEPWSQTVKLLKQFSPFKKLQSLKYRNMVIKGGDDLRQQIICMQLIYKMQSIITDAGLDIFIKPYQIIVLSENSGMLQFVSNSISIDAMKKQMDLDIHQFYAEVFNTEQRFISAKSNFIKSLAGSSILTYILKLRDRHNGNILLDIDGNIIHIDFGFILGMSPGGINFQSSPFKFTEQYVLLLGGKDSPDYLEFVDLFCKGMNAIRKRQDELCLILEIMMDESDLECFQGFSIDSFTERFELGLNETQFRIFCQNLVEKSCMNSRTVHYDTFQKITNGINP